MMVATMDGPTSAASTTAPQPGDLMLDRNYGRTCAVLAVRPRALLVAVRMQTRSRRGTARYQVRWRPVADLQRAGGQSGAGQSGEAVRLACAALAPTFDRTRDRQVAWNVRARATRLAVMVAGRAP